MQLILYLACIHELYRRKTRQWRNFLVIYLTALCALNTVWMGTSMYSLQATFIDNRNYPGGPIGFIGVQFSLPFNIISNASLVSSNILADGLLVSGYPLYLATYLTIVISSGDV